MMSDEEYRKSFLLWTQDDKFRILYTRKKRNNQPSEKRFKLMWIYLNNSFLSIVANNNNADLLHVRGRREGDIEAVFPDAEPIHTPNRDYAYRTDIPREEVAQALFDNANAIDYTNFKGSIPNQAWDRYDEYMQVWTVMREEQLKR